MYSIFQVADFPLYLPPFSVTVTVCVIVNPSANSVLVTLCVVLASPTSLALSSNSVIVVTIFSLSLALNAMTSPDLIS